MRRVSTDMPNNDMMFHLGIRQFRMDELENKMASQTRVQNLRDDPLAASKSTRYQSVITRMKQYSDNVGTAQDSLRYAEGYLTEGLDILTAHRAGFLPLRRAFRQCDRTGAVLRAV